MPASAALLWAVVSAGGRPGTTEARRPEHRAAQAGQRRSDEQREGILALGRQLDRAVARVSLPNAARLLGRDSARGYRLPGYGLVVVLAARALPSAEGDFVYQLGGPSHIFHLQTKKPPAGDPQLPAEIESVERQVVILQHQTEQTRQAAERDMERIMHELRVRTAAAEGTSKPEAVPASTGETPSGTDAQLPPPPPWKFWFESGATHDDRTPEAVIADVRRALVDALSRNTGHVPGLLPEESVTVAVDFEPAGLFVTRSAPARTLIVRARVRDLEARARGAITVEELRRRLEVSEY
jgi:hypothetical protein